ERAFEVPHAGEVVERAADDLARPLQDVVPGGGVVGPGRAGGETGHRAARLGRPLVEVLLVPGGGEGAQVTGELAAGGGDRRRRGLGTGLGVHRVGGGGEGHGEEGGGGEDGFRRSPAIGVERFGRLGLVGAGHQAAVGAGPEGAPRLVPAGRIAVGHERPLAGLAARLDHAEPGAGGDPGVGAPAGVDPEQPDEGGAGGAARFGLLAAAAAAAAAAGGAGGGQEPDQADEQGAVPHEGLLGTVTA